MNNGKDHIIIRDRSTIPGQFREISNQDYFKSSQIGNGANGNVNAFVSPATTSEQLKFGKIITKNCNCLPQIAIKRKNNDSPSIMNTEVVLLNGNWDTSNKIPNIIAEMHNVNIEELQALQNTWTSKLVEQSSDTLDLSQCITPSPRGSDSGIEGDCTDGNLSWLLNYRIHELPPVPDSATSEHQSGVNHRNTSHLDNVNQIYSSENVPKQYFEQNNMTGIILNKQSNSTQKDENIKLPGHSYRYSGPKKPPFTYTELIEHALHEKGELTVSGIYQWISDHFPFYKQNDDRWKNSVRHNLSINPHFRKGSKAVHGAGHLWTIAQKDDKKTWNIKKQRMQQFMKTSYNYCNRDQQLEMELETATASILPENHGEKNEFAIIQQDHNDKQQNIEIEYVNVIEVTRNGLGGNLFTLFPLPPVSKEEVVEECGLGGDYLITDLNPTALGLNLSDAEIINGGTLYDDLNFQCYELQTE